MTGCPLHRFDRAYMNDTVVERSTRPGRGLFIAALDRALARHGRSAPLLAHDLRSEMPASSLVPGPTPAGIVGTGRTRRPPRGTVTAACSVLGPRLGERTAVQAVDAACVSFGGLAAKIPPQLNAGGRHLLSQSAFTIALHQALIAGGADADAATELVADVVFETNRAAHAGLHRIARFRYRDPWDRLRWQSRLLRRFYYAPPAWQLHEVAVPGGHGLDITRCAVADYYPQLGLSDLCERTICAQDVRVADQYGTPVGITFTRTGTIAGGADRRDFRYHPTLPHPAR
jgi:ubiquinone biosynthesis protein